MLEFYGHPPPRSVRAHVLLEGGVIVGVAGYHIEAGVAVVFSDLRPGVSKIKVWRAARMFMDRLDIPAVCVSQNGSGRFLERLGWKFLGSSGDGEVYAWQH